MVSGMFLTCGIFFVESMEKVEFVRARLLLDAAMTEPLERDFNLFFESFKALFRSEADFDDEVETFEGCLWGVSVEVRRISRPRDEMATVTLSDFCSDFPDDVFEVEAWR